MRLGWQGCVAQRRLLMFATQLTLILTLVQPFIAARANSAWAPAYVRGTHFAARIGCIPT